MKRIIFFCFACAALSLNVSFAMDWHTLHEQADAMNLEQAFAGTKKSPGKEESWYVLGLVYLNHHKETEAKAAFEKVLAIDPGSVEGEWGIAESLRRMHKEKEAQVLLEEVLKKQPDFAPARITLGYIRYIQMDFESTVRLALKVIENGREKSDLSNYTRAYAMYAGAKGMIAHYGGLFSKAINGTAVLPNLKTAEKLQPDSAPVLFGLGSFYLLAPKIAGGDPKRSEEYFNKALKADPEFPDVYARLSQLYELKKDKQKAQEMLNKALAIDPDNQLALDIKNRTCKFVCVNK